MFRLVHKQTINKRGDIINGKVGPKSYLGNFIWCKANITNTSISMRKCCMLIYGMCMPVGSMPAVFFFHSDHYKVPLQCNTKGALLSVPNGTILTLLKQQHTCGAAASVLARVSITYSYQTSSLRNTKTLSLWQFIVNRTEHTLKKKRHMQHFQTCILKDLWPENVMKCSPFATAHVCT